MAWPGLGDIWGRIQILSFVLVSDQKERSILELRLCVTREVEVMIGETATTNISAGQAKVDRLRNGRSLDQLKIVDSRCLLCVITLPPLTQIWPHRSTEHPRHPQSFH